MDILVKVGTLPGRLSEIALHQNDATVATALEVAELDPAGYEIRVNTRPATLDTVLANGDGVYLLKKIKGNQDHVRIGTLPGRIQEIALPHGSTVATALEVAELDPTGYEIRVNTRPAYLDTVLANGDGVYLLKKIKGNK